MAKVTVVSIGSYGSKVIVPSAKIGAFMEILSHCQVVAREWIADDSFLVMTDTTVGMEVVDANAVLTPEQAGGIRKAHAEEKAAAESAES